jgi:phage-related protein
MGEGTLYDFSIKKMQKTPTQDLSLARNRQKIVEDYDD